MKITTLQLNVEYFTAKRAHKISDTTTTRQHGQTTLPLGTVKTLKWQILNKENGTHIQIVGASKVLICMCVLQVYEDDETLSRCCAVFPVNSKERKKKNRRTTKKINILSVWSRKVVPCSVWCEYSTSNRSKLEMCWLVQPHREERDRFL